METLPQVMSEPGLVLFRFTVEFFALELRKALACLTTNAKGSKVSNLINDLAKVLNKRLTVTEKLIKCLKENERENGGPEQSSYGQKSDQSQYEHQSQFTSYNRNRV